LKSLKVISVVEFAFHEQEWFMSKKLVEVCTEGINALLTDVSGSRKSLSRNNYCEPKKISEKAKI